MAGVTFMATADEGTGARWTNFTGTIDDTHARTGTYAYQLDGNEVLTRSVSSSATTPYVRVAAYSTTTGVLSILFRESTTNHLSLTLDFTAGTLNLRRSTSVLETYSAGVAINTWYCVEVQGTIHNTTGTAQVRLNGVEIAELALTDQDTQNGGTGVCDNVHITISNDSVWIDDVMFRDDTWPGQGGIYLTTVNAEATSGTKEWTASASTPDACVDEIPATFDDYISRDNLETGDTHEFEHSGIPNLSYENITAVGVIAYAKLASAGSGSVKATYYDPANAGGEQGAAVALDTSGVYIEGYFLDDYGTDAWTRTSVNQLYIGVEVGAVP